MIESTIYPNDPKRNKYGFILFGLACLLLSIGLHYCTPKPKHKSSNNDSLRLALKIQEKQIGILLNEIQAATDSRVASQNKINENKTVYITSTQIVHDHAPDTCKPYIAAVKAECATIMMMYDTVITKYQNEVFAYDTTVKALQSNNETLKHFNDKLEAEVNVSDKKAKRAKFVSKLVTGSVLEVVGVITVVTSFANSN